MLADIQIFACSPGCLGIFALSFIPSLIWLAFFWVQDKNPEPKRIILRVFLWGFLIAIPVIVIENMLQYYAYPLFTATGTAWLYGFLGIALIEETAKYLTVRYKAVPLRVFDEPQDAIIYMITVALGFAAIENFFYAFSAYNLGFSASMASLAGRFITSTLLHVVSSGILGYFLARIYFLEQEKNSLAILLTGLMFSTVLHGLYNYFIIQTGGYMILSVIPVMPVALLLTSSVFLLFLYWHLRTFSYQ
ncbi:MAG: PrsW family intramembrane metalloprotease [Candidatus Spechtbacteria bacterium]|nr:PrsW family intramembrane metalloprotease [Candidatus Spechtbacteria bacterium]